jgi:hypothetical protein
MDSLSLSLGHGHVQFLITARWEILQPSKFQKEHLFYSEVLAIDVVFLSF